MAPSLRRDSPRWKGPCGQFQGFMPGPEWAHRVQRVRRRRNAGPVLNLAFGKAGAEVILQDWKKTAVCGALASAIKGQRDVGTQKAMC
jgi:hypothetical protein